MPLDPSWQDIALRLVMTLFVSAAIGLNRGVRGHVAGLRTTILVGLAAAAAMIEANLLLPVDGKTAGSFATLDLMRLPLGILTGVGFIGGGAILKRGNLILGVTTAATLWIATVIGLCIGGGQILLGCTVAALAVMTLWGLKWLDLRIPREHRAALVLTTQNGSWELAAVAEILGKVGWTPRLMQQRRVEGQGFELSFEVRWKQSELDEPRIENLRSLEPLYCVQSFTLVAQPGH